jgi:hypothetical protein
MKMFYTAILAISFFSCSKPVSEPATVDCTGPAKLFSNDVSPIIQRTCNDDSGCHGQGSTNGPGPLLTYPQVFNGRLAIRAAVASGRMPLNGNLSSADKNAILCWIDNGALNN